VSSYKKLIYDKYFSFHNKHLSGSKTINDFIEKFSSYYFYYKKFLPKDKNTKLLDVGCGDGNFVFWLQNLGYYNVEGFDISKEQIEIGLNLGVNNLMISGIKEYFELNRYQYDIIFARDFLEHFTRGELFEIFELVNLNLKPNAKLIVQVPNGEGINLNKIFYGDITHEMAFTESSLRQISLACGFKSIKAYPVQPHPHGFLSFCRFFLWGFKNSSIKFWNYVEQGSASGIYTSNMIVEITK
jgi:2-polyprenyl-3-methyl-5-hydroxy-6-metoxy-1,4-benzoquinol methylase